MTRRAETDPRRRPSTVPVVLGLALLALMAFLAPATGASARSSIADEYLAALDLMASGDADGALERLIAAEIEAAPNGSKEEIERLTNRQMAIVRRLGSASSEGLVPIVHLHEAAYLEHLDQRRLPLAVRSRNIAVELVELYVTLSSRPDTKSVGSDLLASLGGFLQQSTMDSTAIRLYERALELDPDNATARLSLVSLFERQGRYEQTVPHLETMLDGSRRHAGARLREARLRLGVNSLRLGRVEQGLEALEAIRAASKEDWILSLAYQELARQAALAEDHQKARRLALEATGRLPEDASLAVLQAFLDERAGFRQQPAGLRRTLETNAASDEPSPRALYASSSGVALTTLRELNADLARRRLGPLSEALSRRGRRGGGG